MKKLLFATLVATMAGALVFGVAASMSVSSTNLGSGDADVTACDGDGVTTSYTIDTTDASKVDTITVDDVDDLCDGQTLLLTVFDSTPNAVYNASDTVDGSAGTGTSSVTFSPADLDAAAVEDITVTING